MAANTLAVQCTGMAKGTPPEPCIMVILGVAGDLAQQMLLPALYALYCRGLLPERWALIGVARRDWDEASFREHLQANIEKHTPFRHDTWQAFVQQCHFINGDLSSPASPTCTMLGNTIHSLQADQHLPDNVLFYFALPPSVYQEVSDKMAGAGLLSSSAGWRRIILEKPFGHNETSARDLDWFLNNILEETQIYRIDHFLGKETVQNMLAFRFANPNFEPIWNRQYIDHVQITVAENGGIGTRAGYYDTAGVVRDMLQNHLLQLLCITAMEPPENYDANALRDATVQVLHAVRPIDPRTDCVLGQYGQSSDGKMRAYREEDRVPTQSITPTFVALTLQFDNWRWAGVPFYLRTGKRLPRKVSEITLQFRPSGHQMFRQTDNTPLPGNTLTFRLSPEEGIVQTFVAKQPGPGMCVQPVTMDFRYATAFGLEHLPSAYEWLLLDAMHGDQTLFPRADWIYQAWSMVDPINTRWEALPPAELPNYAAGSWGPATADDLLQRDARKWYLSS